MPRPAYIVCSQLGSIDQYTNSISCFNIVEGLGAIAAPDGPDGQPATRGETFPPIRIVATWLRDEDESPDQTFESEIWVLFRSPQGEQPLGIGRYEPFSFSTRYYRCIVP